jgi:sphingomyelin phosphodiesterase acid-like 3
LDLMRNITELLGRTFPSQFVFPVLGHEDVQNSDYKDYKSFLVSLGSIWRQWLPLEALQTFEKGMLYPTHFASLYGIRGNEDIYIINLT